MKIFSITPIAFAMLFLFIVISHMALQGDAVIVVMSKGLVRKPQAVSKKQSSSVVVAGKIRRNSKTAKGRNKRKWIKSWISRVLRKNGNFRAKTCCKQQNTTRHNKRIMGRIHYNKSRLKN